jgi:hypothetical protein
MQSEGKSCPIKGPICDKFCALPLDRQLSIFNGGLLLAICILGLMAHFFFWLVPLVAGGMLYSGITGQCPVRKKLMSCQSGESCES